MGTQSSNKLWVILLVITLCAVFVLSPWHQILAHVRELSQIVRGFGAPGVVVSILAFTILVTIGCPRLPLCTVAGLTYGFLTGFIVAEVGAMAGYYAVFLFVRWGGSTWVTRRWPKLAQVSGLIRDSGTPGVILLRQIPIHGGLINIVLGLSSISHRSFLLGTAIGLMPEAAPFTLMGSGLTHSSSLWGAGCIVGGVVIFAIGWLVAKVWLKKRRTESDLPVSAELLKSICERTKEHE